MTNRHRNTDCIFNLSVLVQDGKSCRGSVCIEGAARVTLSHIIKCVEIITFVELDWFCALGKAPARTKYLRNVNYYRSKRQMTYEYHASPRKPGKFKAPVCQRVVIWIRTWRLPLNGRSNFAYYRPFTNLFCNWELVPVIDNGNVVVSRDCFQQINFAFAKLWTKAARKN